MAVFNWIPDLGFSVEVKPSVKTVSFGDGYEQRRAEGINAMGYSWSLTFKRSKIIIASIVAFLLARNGTESFDFAAPNGTTYRVVATDGWTVVDSDVGWQTLTVKFKLVYE